MERSELVVGACLIGVQDQNDQPYIVRADPNDMYITYDGENDVWKRYSGQELIDGYDCVDVIPDDVAQDLERIPPEFSR